jgi:hypothetical protein
MTTTKQTNVRFLCTIADDIHKLERKSITDIGDLLLEAKAQCEHGQWLDWLGANTANGLIGWVMSSTGRSTPPSVT